MTKNSIFNEKSHENKRDLIHQCFNDDPTEVIKSINDEFCLYDTTENNFSSFCTLILKKKTIYLFL